MMKRILACAAVLTAAVSFAGAGRAAAQVGQTVYIKEVAVAAHDKSEDAKKQLRENGYSVIEKDLNEDAGGKYIYLGYKSTTEYNDAITDLIVSVGKGATGDVTIGGYRYTQVTRLNGFNGDLNDEAGGKYLYLKYTKDGKDKTAPAIASLGVILSGSSKSSSNYVKGYESQTLYKSSMDLNYDAGGDYVYLQQNKIAYQGDNRILCGDFKVEHLGARLYKFEIPVVRSDASNQINSLVNASAVMAVNGGETQVLSFSGLDNVDRTWITGDDRTVRVSVGSAGGDILDPMTFSKVSGAYSAPVYGGNHKDFKSVTVLWLSPANFSAEMFRFKGAVRVGSTSGSFTADCTPVLPAVSDGINGTMVIDPFVNTSATCPGWSQTLIISASEMYSLAVYDATADKLVHIENIGDGRTSCTVDLQHDGREHDLVSIALGRTTVMGSDGTQDYGTQLFTSPILQKAFHGITLAENAMGDNDGAFTTSNTFRWGYDNPRDEDLIEQDEYLIERAFRSDFSDAVLIDSKFMYDSTRTVMDGVEYAMYEYTDNDDAGRFNSEAEDSAGTDMFRSWKNISADAKSRLAAFSYPGHYTYYRVRRAFVSSMWPDDSNFEARWRVLGTNVLPVVSSVSVSPSDSWEQDRKVDIEITLDSPYPWECVAAADSAAVHREAVLQKFTSRMFTWNPDARIVIRRYSPVSEWNASGLDEVAKTITVSGQDVKWDEESGTYRVTVTDLLSAPETHYYYSATVDASTTSWPICTGLNGSVSTTDAMAERCRFSDLAAVSDLQASLGTVQGMIALTWEADRGFVDRFDVRYRKYGTQEWQDLRSVNECTLNVVEQAMPGTVYEFQVTAVAIFRGVEYRSEPATVTGYNPYYGTIAGHVRLSNGAAMPGGAVQIEFRRDGALRVDEVRDAGTSALIMPGLDEDSFLKRVTVEPDGSYRCDSIPYMGSGTGYSVRVCGLDAVDFTNRSGNIGTVTVDMAQDSYIHESVDFTCSSLLRVTGNILYSGSTIPVRDAAFKANGTVLKDASGNDIVTDQSGAYSFSIPKGMPIVLQAFKEGHTFADGGYIIGAENAPVTAVEDNIGKVIYDSTTVRLVGRITGGSRQAGVPLGMGIALNNLGDDMLIELKLEGDNTANIVYDIKDPEKTQRDVTFTQTVSVSGSSQELMSTGVTFERKRILIRPDNVTGEFCVDLFPARYKVTAMTARGYSTLYAEGEGLQVIDLSDSIMPKSHDNAGWMTRMMADNVRGWDLKPRSTSYHASFQRVYHVPATVTLQQYDRLHRLKPYFGESDISQTSLQGVKVRAGVAWSDDGVTPQYAFGYPVFNAYSRYRLKVSAHEDYYYNNDRTAGVDRVYLESGKVTLYNGFTAEPQRMEAALDRNGSAELTFDVDNVCFGLTDTDALRTMTAEVNVNGYYYKSDAVSGFVLGEKDAGTEVMTLDSTVQIVDVIRDPYGKHSYAWRDSGTEYHWDRSFYQVESLDFKLNVNVGGGQTSYVGLGLATKCEFSVVPGFNLNIPMRKNIDSKNGEYTMTLNERIQTSDDEIMQGAAADIYVGHVDVAHLREAMSFSIVDSASYSSLADAIRSGGVKAVCHGTSADGKDFHLVTGPKLVVARDQVAGTFAYSQSHITGTVIPQLQKRYDRLVMSGVSREDAERLAASTGTVRYYSDAAGNPCMAVPDDSYEGVNEALMIRNTIQQWKNIISANERTKYEAYRGIGMTPFKSYSVSGSPIEYSESANAYYTSYDCHTMGGHVSGGINMGGGGKRNDDSEINAKNDTVPRTNTTTVKVAGLVVNISLNPLQSSVSTSTSQIYFKKSIVGAGYRLDVPDQGYMDIDVYADKQADMLVANSEWDWLTENMDNRNRNDARSSDFIFVLRGGAVRAPWLDADTTVFYTEMGRSVRLGERCMKIDNPKIYIEDPVVSNVPRDEKAIYSLRLVNETEYSGNAQSIIPIPFSLCMADNLNPGGVKIFMDGAPITDGRQFRLKPGQSITKTIEVMRGDGYDFDNIGLVLHDDTRTLNDTALISVHFMPESSPVHLSAPADKWVMNTLSSHDDRGYYIPVEIDGFDINYDGFDHIELQYKKHTDGESQWVNLCSFYTDRELMASASGTCRLIDKNVISDISFYGEKDPMEMNYDLRAVSFCRLGTGFISRSSNISSGIKDTRAPEVFGKPQPANGILTAADVITVPFNEPVAYNYLDRVANFSVTGFTNRSDANHSARLRFDGNGEIAVTRVERYLSGTGFTVEMLVQLDRNAGGEPSNAVFMSMKDTASTEKVLAFGYSRTEDCLYAILEDGTYMSDPLSDMGISLADAMTHVGLMYDIETDVVSFIAGNAVSEAKVGVPLYARLLTASGSIGKGSPIQVGSSMAGFMADVRIWQRALGAYEVANGYSRKLSGSEKDLMAWWPMDEAYGNVVADRANGADLYLTDVTWETPDGFSARLEGAPLVIDSERADFQTEDGQDFSLAFWFRVDRLDAQAADFGNGGLVNVFAAGADSLNETGAGRMRIGFDADSRLVLQSEGGTYAFGTSGDCLSDGQWHHLAVVSDHARNSVTLLADGSTVGELESDRVGRITASPVSFGGAGFYGGIDEVSMWRIALSGTYVADMMSTALNGREKDLAAYLSFETDELQDDNTLKTVFSACNMKRNPADGSIAGSLMFDPASVIPDENSHAPVKSNVGLQNLDFSWTASDNAIQIDILHDDAEINHQRIDLVLRGVEDLQGNLLANPVMWSVYVDRNVLRWDNQSVSSRVCYGQDATVTASWTNRSGKVMNYTVDTGSRWLTLDRDMGTAGPESTGNVQLHISDGLSPGTYNAVVNLTDENGLVSRLDVNVSVEAQDPVWTVSTDSKYNRTMSLTGVVMQHPDNGIEEFDTDTRDIVAAFCDGICLGTAHVTASDGSYGYVYLNIRGNADLSDNLRFYLWDKSRGEIVKLKPDNIAFVADGIAGTHSNPVVFSCDNVSIQSIELEKGWNWISFNLRPCQTQKVGNLFVDNSVFTPGDIIKGSLDNSYYAEYYGAGLWSRGADRLKIGSGYVYQIYVQQPCTVKVEGYELADDERTVRLGAGGWSQLPYLLKVVQPINIAMSDYPIGVKAQPGTIIKSHDSFAVADASGRWYGSLEYMRPGEGYYVNHTGNYSTVVTYTNTTVLQNQSPKAITRGIGGGSMQGEYAGAMPVIASFTEGEYQDGDVLVAYSAGQEVGRANAVSVNGSPVFFLMVNAELGSSIRLAKQQNGSTVAVAPQAVTFTPDAVVGSLDNPHVVDFAVPSGSQTYSIDGLAQPEGTPLNDNEVYIIDRRKVLVTQ